MRVSNRMFVSLLVLGACLQVTALYGQEEKAPMYLEQKGEGEAEQAEPIYTGLVIAYGVRIPPPYYVTFRNDTIRINEVPWGPTRRPPGWNPEVIEVPEWSRREYALFLGIKRIFCDNLKLYGFQVAKDSVIQQYGSDTLLSSLEFGPMGNGIILTYKDDRHLIIDLPSLCLPAPRKAEVDSFMDAQHVQSVAGIRTNLRNGATIIYSYTGGYHYLWKDDAAEFQRIMRDAKRGIITSEDAAKGLKKMMPERYISEIMANLESWD